MKTHLELAQEKAASVLERINGSPEDHELVYEGAKSATEHAYLFYNKPATEAGHIGTGFWMLIDTDTQTVKSLGTGGYPKIAEEYIDSPYNQQRLAQEAKQTG